jgi:hypothetical protein
MINIETNDEETMASLAVAYHNRQTMIIGGAEYMLESLSVNPAWGIESLAVRGDRVTRVEWTGAGRPPVGAVCDTSWDSGNKVYVTCKILAHDEGMAVFRFTSGPRKGEYESAEPCMLGSRQDVPQFRPLPTPEQLAAEAREKAIEKARALFKADEAYPFTVLLGMLYDAGMLTKQDGK